VRSRPGWTRYKRSADSKGFAYVHEASGVEVRHCGHPTANWPYTVNLPDGRMVTSNNGRAFKYVDEAQEVGERLAADLAMGAAPSIEYAPCPRYARWCITWHHLERAS
jgi:hypothetical protein